MKFIVLSTIFSILLSSLPGQVWACAFSLCSVQCQKNQVHRCCPSSSTSEKRNKCHVSAQKSCSCLMSQTSDFVVADIFVAQEKTQMEVIEPMAWLHVREAQNLSVYDRGSPLVGFKCRLHLSYEILII